jgi:hypothetical protein
MSHTFVIAWVILKIFEDNLRGSWHKAEPASFAGWGGDVQQEMSSPTITSTSIKCKRIMMDSALV